MFLFLLNCTHDYDCGKSTALFPVLQSFQKVYIQAEEYNRTNRIIYVNMFKNKIAKSKSLSTQEQRMFSELEREGIKKIYVTENFDVWAVVDSKNKLIEQKETLIGIQGTNKMNNMIAFGTTKIIQISKCNYDSTYSAVAVIPLVD